MKKYFLICPAARIFQTKVLFLFAVALFLAFASPAAAQKEKKKKKDTSPPADASNMMIPLPDEQQIDYALSEMLGAWQIGDIEKLHKDYADDVSNLPGAKHVGKHVINLLLIGQGNHHIGSIRRGRSVLLLFLFLLCCAWRRTSQEERGGKEQQNRCLEDAGGGTN